MAADDINNVNFGFKQFVTAYTAHTVATSLHCRLPTLQLFTPGGNEASSILNLTSTTAVAAAQVQTKEARENALSRRKAKVIKKQAEKREQRKQRRKCCDRIGRTLGHCRWLVGPLCVSRLCVGELVFFFFLLLSLCSCSLFNRS